MPPPKCVRTACGLPAQAATAVTPGAPPSPLHHPPTCFPAPVPVPTALLVAAAPVRPATAAQARDVQGVWTRIREEVGGMVAAEPESGGLLHHGVTIHDSLEACLVGGWAWAWVREWRASGAARTS